MSKETERAVGAAWEAFKARMHVAADKAASAVHVSLPTIGSADLMELSRAIRADERAKVVAWLRESVEAPTGDGFGPYGKAMTERFRWFAEDLSDAIESGAHNGGENG